MIYSDLNVYEVTYKIILYAYMNNIYSFRKMERAVQRDIHFIWFVAQERPDFVTINRFRNRVKKGINNIFTQVVLVLTDKGLIALDVEYIDGIKIETKANSPPLYGARPWRRTGLSFRKRNVLCWIR